MTQNEFITELKYIRNISGNTLELYELAFRAFSDATVSRAAMVVRITQLAARHIPICVGWLDQASVHRIGVLNIYFQDTGNSSSYRAPGPWPIAR